EWLAVLTVRAVREAEGDRDPGRLDSPSGVPALELRTVSGALDVVLDGLARTAGLARVDDPVSERLVREARLVVLVVVREPEVDDAEDEQEDQRNDDRELDQRLALLVKRRAAQAPDDRPSRSSHANCSPTPWIGHVPPISAFAHWRMTRFARPNRVPLPT